MYRINPTENRISKLEQKTFQSMGFRERNHLQQWIANMPECLGEDLLIIQEEFAGFEETRERLDLLALDKQGNLVIIENKLDDSGRDVTWQALKYASYCSSLSREQIIRIYQEYLDKQEDQGGNAEENLQQFLDEEEFELNKGSAQRLILIAGDFRKEVTSTVMWLLNYGLRIQCFKVELFQEGEQLYLSFDQIIPVKDIEELQIKMAQKVKEEISAQSELKTRHLIRKKFWTKLLGALQQKTNLYQNISPGIYSWISAGSGVRGIGYNFNISRKASRVEIYIDRQDKEENENCFDFFYSQKEKIEATFGEELTWERLHGKRACRIKFEIPKNFYEEEAQPAIIEFLVDAMVRLEKSFREPIRALGKKLK